MESPATPIADWTLPDDTWKPKSTSEMMEAYLLAHSNNPLKVEIKDQFSKRKLMFNKKLVFVISVSRNGQPAESVERDYKDFVALREGLTNRFVGVFLPILPPASLIGTPKDDNLGKFKSALQFFLNVIARNPFFREDSVFNDFITHSGFDRKSAKLKGKKAHRDSSKFENAPRKWDDLVLSCTPPTNRVAYRAQVLSELHAHLKEYGHLKSALKHLINVSEEYAVSYSAVTKVLGRWSTFDKDKVQSTRGETVYTIGGGATDENNNPNNPHAGENVVLRSKYVLEQTMNKSGMQADVHSCEASQMRRLVLDSIRNEMYYIDELIKAVEKLGPQISKHGKAVQNYQAAVKQEADKLRENLQAAGDDITTTMGAFPSRFAHEQSQKLQHLKLDVLQLQRNVNRRVCGILVVEVDRWKSERTIRLSQTMNCFARIQHDLAKKTGQIWEGLVQSLPTDIPATFELVFLGSQSAMAASGPQAPPNPAPDSVPVTFPLPHVTDVKHVDHAFSAPSTDEPSRASLGASLSERQSVRALYEFRGENPDELDVQEGELLEGSLDENDPNWFVVEKEGGKSGLVPTNFLQVLDTISDTEQEHSAPSNPVSPARSVKSDYHVSSNDDDDDEWDDGGYDNGEHDNNNATPLPAPTHAPPLPTAPKPEIPVQPGGGGPAASSRGDLLSAISGFDKSQLQNA